jgi:hypothetical protein
MISSLLDLDSAGIFDGFRPLRVDEEVTRVRTLLRRVSEPVLGIRIRDPVESKPFFRIRLQLW